MKKGMSDFKNKSKNYSFQHVLETRKRDEVVGTLVSFLSDCAQSNLINVAIRLEGAIRICGTPMLSFNCLLLPPNKVPAAAAGWRKKKSR